LPTGRKKRVEGPTTKEASADEEEEESHDEVQNLYSWVQTCHRQDAVVFATGEMQLRRDWTPARCGAVVGTVVGALCGGD
jgi:hypothetical protein